MPPPAPVWAYAYQIEPAQRQDGVGAIRNILNAEHLIALREGRRWASRLVFSWRSTRILIVSDRRVPDGEVNRKLEVEIRWLHAHFTITEAVALCDAEPARGTHPRHAPAAPAICIVRCGAPPKALLLNSLF